MDVTPKDSMIAEARDGLENGMKVELLINGAWLEISELIRVDEIGLMRAGHRDGTMVLFPDSQLGAVSIKGL